MEEQPADTMMEERVELMVPPTGGKPTLRTAYFLKPTHLEETLSSHSLLSSNLIIPDSKKNQLNVLYPGWKRPQKGWKKWVDQLRPLYGDTWKKAGIFDAILASTYHTLRDNDLIINLGEKWCPDTNTFLFPWGEATITLEDMMVLGGYSVLGNLAVSAPITEDMLRLRQELSNTHDAISRSRGQYARDCAWMQHFKGSGEKLEHEAFLALWLSRYVFSTYYDVVRKDVFNIAISLSRGISIALAPAVLASIYRDMGLLKKSLITEIEDGKCGSDELSKLTLSAPLHLVQLWAWERFPALRPKPNHIEFGEPRIARWHKLAEQNDEDIRKALDSAGEDFQWRPYTTKVENWNFEKFYKENQECILVDSGLDFEVESSIRCLRVSELVGFDCIELYLPHRVTMQFGFDQDIPGIVQRPYYPTPEIAWSNYNRPIRDARLCRPARLFESDVTKRYLEWWDKMKTEQENATSRNVVLPGFTSHIHEVQQQVYDDDDEITLAELMNRKKWAHRNDETEVSGSLKIRTLDEILMCAEKSTAIKPTRSATSSVRSEDENLERVLEKFTTNNTTSVKSKESLASIDKNEEESYKHGVGEQIESKTETVDDNSVAGGVESPSEIAEISEQKSPALPERLNRKDEVEKLEGRISYLERIIAEMKTAKYGQRK